MDDDSKYNIFKISNSEYLPGGFKELSSILENAHREKKKLRVKLGIDPTSADLHLGHTVCLNILRKFQELGHKPVLIIGGFTAAVGDPSGRNEARPPLSYEQVEENAKTYLNQVKKILDLNNVEIVNNYDWLSKLTSADLIKLAHLVTVNQLVAKEAFGTRLQSGEPLYLHETLYPILQGYDSVQIKSDIEIGGLDQKFNVLFGRQLQKHFNQKEQFVMLFPLLIGLDGSKKMSKSFNNYIGLNDLPSEIFGKTMSIPDDLILNYFTLASDLSYEKIEEFKSQLNAGENPRNIKLKLAHCLTRQFYNLEEADKAESNFIKQFSKNELPEEINEYKLEKSMKIADFMFEAKLTTSKTEAKKLIQGGGVKLNSNKISDPNYLISEDDKNLVIQVGKRKFVKII